MTSLPAPARRPSPPPAPRARSRGSGALVGLALPLLCLLPSPVSAQSRTAESIWSQSDAQQRAIEQVPLEDRAGISQTRCQEVGVGRMGSLPRFRCTVWFDTQPKPGQP